ncbi:MAG TPA: phosphopantetheine-binding protein [Candidatus Limiplasma sp.]|nr:phosphopantetheine-binding protein [Candidatus Limiplasma sp.]HRX08076.1 phosphopantetheine-binding protein [Candidatus Limiplasma sp.]
MSTYETIAKLLAESKDLDVNDIRPEMGFAELELDSLDVAELVMNLEDELGVPVEIDESLRTIADLVAKVDNAK